MKSITFTCTTSTEEIQKIAHQKELMTRICLLLQLALYPFILYKLWPKDGIHDSILLLLFFFIATMLSFLSGLIVYYWKQSKHAYLLMPTKVFGWDENTSQFFYKDDERSLRFKSTDIKKWYSLEDDNYDASAEISLGQCSDIIHLQTGEKIVLENLWNESVHEFLKNNRFALDLPQPQKTCTWY